MKIKAMVSLVALAICFVASPSVSAEDIQNKQEQRMDSEDIQRKYVSCIDLRKARMSGADFSNQDLSFLDARKAQLRRANFQNSDVRGADFRKANLEGADFRGAKNINSADFRKARMRGALMPPEFIEPEKSWWSRESFVQ